MSATDPATDELPWPGLYFAVLGLFCVPALVLWGFLALSDSVDSTSRSQDREDTGPDGIAPHVAGLYMADPDVSLHLGLADADAKLMQGAANEGGHWAQIDLAPDAVDKLHTIVHERIDRGTARRVDLRELDAAVRRSGPIPAWWRPDYIRDAAAIILETSDGEVHLACGPSTQTAYYHRAPRKVDPAR